MVEDKVKQEIEPYHYEYEKSDLQRGADISQEEELCASKERRQSTAGMPRRILDLDVDLFPLPAKYCSLKNGIEILIRRLFFVSHCKFNTI